MRTLRGHRPVVPRQIKDEGDGLCGALGAVGGEAHSGLRKRGRAAGSNAATLQRAREDAQSVLRLIGRDGLMVPTKRSAEKCAVSLIIGRRYD